MVCGTFGLRWKNPQSIVFSGCREKKQDIFVKKSNSPSLYVLKELVHQFWAMLQEAERETLKLSTSVKQMK